MRTLHIRGDCMRIGLGVIERKVLGALLILANENNTIEATLEVIAQTMGYKSAGGALTFALKSLERENYIAHTGKHEYRVLV